MTLPAIIVFSHLRWDFVYQRPQHLISRLGASRQIYFIEEPIFTDRTPDIVCRTGAPGVTICTPRTPLQRGGFTDEQNGLIRPLVRQLIKDKGLDDYVLWFYSPMALPIAESLSPAAVVYDCMDELSAFADAPPQLLERESELLTQADVVFTGGPSLFRAKENRHPRVYCFSSSVDAAHFGKGRLGGEESPLQAYIPGPRLGFFGVIDERFDIGILEELARTRPQWQFMMVGPILKIDPRSLPRYANIHYLGQQSYDELPRLLAGWDVCLLPFARNDATKFISPTKTLEYMAAGRMIVSTPIRDVAEPYGDIVFLGDNPTEFRDACEQALHIDSGERAQRVAKMTAVLANTSWDATASAMAGIIDEVVEGRRVAAKEEITCGTQVPCPFESKDADANDRAVVIIGAGPTGLSAAYHLGDDALLLEANDTIGGWCRSIQADGFTFDYAGHIMFSNDAYVHEMYEMLLGENVHWQDREAWVYSKQVFTRYPFQGALYGLPPAVIKECLLGAIEARYGRSASAGKSHPEANGSSCAKPSQSNGVTLNGHHPKSVEDCCGDGVLESTAPLSESRNGSAASTNGHVKASEPENFEQFIHRVWGYGIAKHFAIPYNKKLWAVPLTEMETSWLGGRVPMPDLAEMIDGALCPAPRPMGPNARFGYPLEGGFQSLMDGFLPHVEDRLRLNTRVAKISPSRKLVTLTTGETIGYDSLISTMPLPVLIRSMGNEAPVDVQQAAEALRNVSVRCVHLGVGRENLTEKHWIYYPEETVFHRIFVQGNASPHCNPSGGFGLTCEITYSAHKPLPCDGDELIQRCIDDCIEVGIINADDPIWTTAQCDLPYAYVVYDHPRVKNIELIRTWLDAHSIHLAGRYSEWEYYNSDHAFLAGKKVAENVRSTDASRTLAIQV